MSTDRWMDEENVVFTYNKILFCLKKEGNPIIYYNMNGLWGHYAKWNKPITEGQILHNYT